MTTHIPVALREFCAACAQFTITQPHCETQHGCVWWVCAACAAANDGAGHWNSPGRHNGNHRAVLAWAAEHGIKQDFTERTN